MDDIGKGIPYVPSDPGFYREDGPVDWLRTIEGIWLVADLEAPYWWTLDVNNMPAVDMAHLHAVTLAEARALVDTVEVRALTRWTRVFRQIEVDAFST